MQADTIVPGEGNPQAYDRYSYVNNNPVNRTDPTGHYECLDTDSKSKCTTQPKFIPLPQPVVYVIGGYGVGNAVSLRSKQPMDTGSQTQYRGKYPLQPLMEALDQRNIAIRPYDEIFNEQDPSKLKIAQQIINDISEHPNQINIIVAFSAGTASGKLVVDYYKDQWPENQVAGFVALGPETSYQDANKVTQNVTFQDLTDTKRNLILDTNSYPGLQHTDLAVNQKVMNDVVNFILQLIGRR